MILQLRLSVLKAFIVPRTKLQLLTMVCHIKNSHAHQEHISTYKVRVPFQIVYHVPPARVAKLTESLLIQQVMLITTVLQVSTAKPDLPTNILTQLTPRVTMGRVPPVTIVQQVHQRLHLVQLVHSRTKRKQ